MNQLPSSLLLIINLFISVVVPLILNYIPFIKHKPNIFEICIYSFSTFICLTCIEILFYAKSIHQKEKKELEIWENRNEIETRLNDIRSFFLQIEKSNYGKYDLFFNYFKQKIESLHSMMVSAAKKNEVTIDGTMFVVTTDLYFSAFNGEPEDIFRAVHYCSDNDFFFNVHAKSYFYRAFDMVESGKIRKVKRLIVYKNKEE